MINLRYVKLCELYLNLKRERLYRKKDPGQEKQWEHWSRLAVGQSPHRARSQMNV